MKTTDDEAVSLAEITDLAWAFVKDRFPQPEARARLATALGALMGGSYRQLQLGEGYGWQPTVAPLSPPAQPPLGQHDTSHWDVSPPHPLATPPAAQPEGFRVQLLSVHPVGMTDAQREEQARNFAAGNFGLENPRVTRESIDRAAARMEAEDRRHGQILGPGEGAREGLAFRGVD